MNEFQLIGALGEFYKKYPNSPTKYVFDDFQKGIAQIYQKMNLATDD